MVDFLVQERYSVPEILLKLLTPAAPYLGDMRDQDRLDFSPVTMGLLRMQNMKDIMWRASYADWFDILRLSVGLVEQLDTLPALVKALRSHSLNPHMGVLLGGVAFTHFGAAQKSYAADAVCLDPLDAMRVARKLAAKSPGSPKGRG